MAGPRALVADRAWVLHRVPYRERSWLADLLAEVHGPVSVVARASLRRMGSGFALDPFVPLRVAWTGRGELKTLVEWGADGPGLVLADADAALAGLYLNDLMRWVSRRLDYEAGLAAAYARTLPALAGSGRFAALRRLELDVLGMAGFGLHLDREVTGAPVTAAGRYRYDFEAGLVRVDDAAADGIQGAALLALDAGQGEGHEREQLALTQSALRHYLHYQGYARFADCARFAHRS